MTDELISVVITCYNLEAYIGAAIASVYAQHRGGRFEVIVVDDASTDNSKSVINHFTDVRLIEMESNSGVMLAMLAGIAAACGDVICLLDGDDIWEPGKLTAMRKAFAAQDVALVTHDLSFIDAFGHSISRNSRPRQVLGACAADQRGEAVRQGILRLGDYVWLGSALSFRRRYLQPEMFTHWVMAQPDPRHMYQDWPLAYWLASLPVAIAYVDLPLMRYRLHAANHSGDARTAERALRNFARTHNTLAAISVLAEDRIADLDLLMITRARCRLALAQQRFYEGRLADGWPHLLAVAGFLAREGGFFREFVRAFTITILGPAGLICLKRRLEAWR